MHLKSLEMIGFKSFADRTKLEFEPGMVAIVGPNGCGKSNVSDAIRWVLGEQRPTALRGAKMQDVIFNGTDSRKPTGMAEVSITFADCESVLPTEFNEVTVSRRVFRTGESAYFINKTPCRLRDIHRLFMGTGIGTTSYSVMAQGQIDAVLSSKPEDRRAIFEEAAGITKFKADRKEALRKLEQTDANLLRLADVIREVKRQIGSLQRQAGKAQRYKELRDEMRGLDLFATRRRLAALDVRLRDLDAEIAAHAAQDAERQEQVAEAEAGTAAIHAAILANEHATGAATEAAAQAAGRLQHAAEMIRVGEQRIEEYRTWSARDTQEATETRRQIEELTRQQVELEAQRQQRTGERDQARQSLEQSQLVCDEHRRAIDQGRRELQAERDAAVERERRAARLQNQLAEMEARQRDMLLRRERLSAEQDQLAQSLTAVERSRDQLDGQRQSLRHEAAAFQERLAEAEAERQEAAAALRATQEEISRLRAQLAGRVAQIELLTEQEERAEEFPAGSRLLLDAANPLRLDAGIVLGTLADRFKASAEYRPALEAVLRAWIDAVVVRHSGDAPAVVRALLKRGEAAGTRLVAAAGAPPPQALPVPAGLSALSGHVEVADDFAEAGQRLLANVFVAGTLDAVPTPVPAGCTIVTLGGALFRADGCAELWMPEGQSASPLGRRMSIADGREQAAGLERQLQALGVRAEELAGRGAALGAAVTESRTALDESRRKAAQKEGEWQSACRDADRSRQRHEVVSAELRAALAQSQGADEERAGAMEALQELVATREQAVEALAQRQAALQEIEGRYAERSQELTEHRIRHAHLCQQVEHAGSQLAALASRLTELQRVLQGRSQGVQSYDESIRKLAGQIAATQAQLAPMQAQSEQARGTLETLRRERGAKARELERAEALLAEVRRGLEETRSRRGRLEVELAEARMRRQNQLERVQSEYGLSPEQLVAESDPAWPGGQAPELSEAEARVAQLAADLQAMGPVNLVAIDEYKELEERYTFLRAQEDDMVKSKEQILDLIRMINKKTSEMFRETFQQANTNFEAMFTKLFNGGTARLVLLENAEDPLECGVDVVARPPGKRPQSISLLSGGERTMTAVSLLFAIYMIKPSPFCMLDELDAALDDSNIGRFVQALKDFLSQSQFLIITHNQHTITSSDIVYGVTMPEKGVSKIVSMRLKEIGVRELEIAREAPPEPEPEEGRRRRRKHREVDAAEPEALAEALPE